MLRVCVLCALCALALAADDNVTVVRLQLSLEEEHQLTVLHTREYILQFVPTAEQSQHPSRVWVQARGGHAARPLLLTARQRTGAITWQLPYRSGDSLLYELERTLCPHTAPHAGAEPAPGEDDCAEQDEEPRRGQFSLHVASSCAAPVAVALRVAVLRDWRLRPDTHTHTALTQASPRVYYYQFPAEEAAVRLVLSSEDDVCATVAVQDCSCPIAESPDEIAISTTLRMTVQRSGGAHLSRERFGGGFYVIGAIGDSDAACTGEQAEEAAWLWQDAVGWPTEDEGAPAPPRVKHLTLEVKPPLSRLQYWVGASVTLLVFLLFYVMFGALVLAERWPAWYRLVAPKAVLAEPEREAPGDDNRLESARRRRASDATFDGSDNSDTDSEEDAATATTRTTAVPSPPAPGAPSPTVTGAPSSPETDAPPAAATVAPASPEPQARSPATEAPAPAAAANGAAPADGITTDTPADSTAARDEVARPFGLPAVLTVQALARRRARVLRARSDRYLYALATVAVFYALPVVQFVAAFQVMFNVSGSLDLCYYNFLCAHPLGALADFNHVLSNLGYLLLGALLLLQLRRRRARRRRRPRHAAYGIPHHDGLLAALGAGMMAVALLSASYHVCPNRLNFQFDTAFMYVLAVLSMVKIYQARHADINARAHATFAVLAVMMALVVWGVLGAGPLFWAVFTVVHVFTFLLLSLQIYYVGQFRLEKASLVQTARSLRAPRPLYTQRLVALLLANGINWAFALYGLARQPADMASHLLSVLLCNVLVYMCFYMCMKLVHGERPRWYAWVSLGGAAAAWAPALYFFLAGSTDWAATPAQSRHRNHECRVLQFYDAHDLWHGLSAAALYLTFNAMLTWDDGLSAVPRADIAVF